MLNDAYCSYIFIANDNMKFCEIEVIQVQKGYTKEEQKEKNDMPLEIL